MRSNFYLLSLSKNVHGAWATLINSVDGVPFDAPLNPKYDSQQIEAIFKYEKETSGLFDDDDSLGIFMDKRIAIVEHDGFFEDKTPRNPIFITINGAF